MRCGINRLPISTNHRQVAYAVNNKENYGKLSLARRWILWTDLRLKKEVELFRTVMKESTMEFTSTLHSSLTLRRKDRIEHKTNVRQI